MFRSGILNKIIQGLDKTYGKYTLT